MKKKKVLCLIATVAVMTLLFANAGFADVPAPPANQTIGIDDGIFNNLVEAECRVCHDDPGVVGSTPNVDRHHLLYGNPLPQGECSVNLNACLSDADCDPGICSSTGPPPGVSCTNDSDCPNAGLGETCGEVCIGETVVPILDANQDGTDDTNYGCLNCHEQTLVGGVITFIVTRDCLQCHVQVPGEGSVHHLTAKAQGIDSPLGDPAVGDCTPCHGTLVDDIGDGHQIPVYIPSLVTPSPSGGDGEPVNSRGNGAGACDYCHDAGTDTATSVEVFTNADTHHNTGVFQSETGVINNDTCVWCHNMSLPDEYVIRTCEGCHGLESLHNVQTDSDASGDIVVGGELPGYGHVGADNPGAGSDCWGCHGFSAVSAPDSGPLTPYISGSDRLVITAGTDTEVTLTGSAFTNLMDTFQWMSEIALTAADGYSVNLTPDSITQGSLTVTIPGNTVPGNYTLQAVKGEYASSNPVVISIKPEVVITNMSCNEGILTITGSGFGDAPPEGVEEYINVKVDGVAVEITSWTDTEIIASVASCGETVTVNTLFSLASYDSKAACDCEGNFDSDSDVDGSDAVQFKADFGRNMFNSPCESSSTCNGDFDCDQDVDGADAAKFKEDFGRSSFNNPCPACAVEEWCNYL